MNFFKYIYDFWSGKFFDSTWLLVILLLFSAQFNFQGILLIATSIVKENFEIQFNHLVLIAMNLFIFNTMWEVVEKLMDRYMNKNKRMDNE